MPGKPLLVILLCACGLAAWHWQERTGNEQASLGDEKRGGLHPQHGSGHDLTKSGNRPRSLAEPVEKLRERARAALQSASNEERRIALDTLLPDLLEKDLDAAAELVAGLEPWAASDEATALLLDHWSESDPTAAAAWCARLDSTQRGRWLCRISNALAQRDPAAAMAMLEEHQLSSDPTASGTVLHHWARRDMTAASEWVSLQADEALRDASWNRIAMSLSESQPAQAATLVAEKIADPLQQEEAVISVLHQWILRDRKAAAAWVALFPDDSLRQRAEAEFPR